MGIFSLGQLAQLVHPLATTAKPIVPPVPLAFSRSFSPARPALPTATQAAITVMALVTLVTNAKTDITFRERAVCYAHLL